MDPDIYALGQERIFRGPVWNFVGLKAQIPNLGDYKAVQIADTPVIVSCDRDGSVHAWVNRCARRNAKICLDTPTASAAPTTRGAATSPAS
ncbi:MAG: hypothetical protein Kow0073_16840 [Immundisolibacter sp.]